MSLPFTRLRRTAFPLPTKVTLNCYIFLSIFQTLMHSILAHLLSILARSSLTLSYHVPPRSTTSHHLSKPPTLSHNLPRLLLNLTTFHHFLQTPVTKRFCQFLTAAISTTFLSPDSVLRQLTSSTRPESGEILVMLVKE